MTILGDKSTEIIFDTTHPPIKEMGKMYLKFQNEYECSPIIQVFVVCKDNSITHREYPYFMYENLNSEGVTIRYTSFDLEKFDLVVRVFGHSGAEGFINFEPAIVMALTGQGGF